MSMFEIFQSLGGNIWIYGGSFILVLSLLVFIHEWGHYIVARLCGVKVEQFSIGFGKEIVGFTDKTGTRWKISLIPLGGYVQLFGHSDPASTQKDETVKDGDEVREMTSAERSVAFFSQPVWQRALIVFAGPAINYIFAFIILTLLFTFNGQPVTPPSAAAIISGSAADRAGFEPHDMIISIDGQDIHSFEDVRRETMISLDQERHFVIDRGGKRVDIYAKPDKIEDEDHLGFKQSRGLLGLISPRHAVDIKNIQKINGKSVQPAETEVPEGAEEAVAKDYGPLRQGVTKRLEKVFEIEVAWGSNSRTLIVHPLTEFNEELGVEESQNRDLLFLADISGNSFVQYPLHKAAIQAGKQCWEVTIGTLEALGQIVTGARSATELGGVIRIGALAGDMAKQGVIALILFSAMLSINLGLINLFPIPLLDGGHLVFYFFEALLGKPVPEHIQEYAFRFGLVFLVGVMVFTNLNDLLQLLL